MNDQSPFIEIIVIGVSAGGMNILTEILPQLNPDFQIPILIAQHLHPHQGNFHIEYFSEITTLPIREIEEKTSIQKATIYFVPSNYHVLIEEDKTFALNVDEKVNYARPSIDVLFESVAEVFQKNVLGIILTGANRDGALGLKKIYEFGGITIVQEIASAKFSAMPKFALEAVPSAQQMNIEEIINYLNFLE